VNEAIKAYEGQIEKMAAEVAKNKVRFVTNLEKCKHIGRTVSLWV
jgi:hypothetical protein